jgi:hypothetical protein
MHHLQEENYLLLKSIGIVKRFRFKNKIHNIRAIYTELINTGCLTQNRLSRVTSASALVI